MQLILLRHAKTEPSQGQPPDFQRRLTDAGRAAVAPVVQALLRHGVRPQKALVSSSVRTRETWSIAEPLFRETPVAFLDSLYLASAETLLEEADRSGAASVLLVAHNPGLQDLALSLDHAPSELRERMRNKFPPGAAAVFERARPLSPWRLTAFFSPKELGTPAPDARR